MAAEKDANEIVAYLQKQASLAEPKNIETSNKPNPRSSTFLEHDLPTPHEIYETVIWDEDDQLQFESESSYDPAKDPQVIDFSMLYEDSEEEYETSGSSSPPPTILPQESVDVVYKPMEPNNESVVAEHGIHFSDDLIASQDIIPYDTVPKQSSVFSEEFDEKEQKSDEQQQQQTSLKEQQNVDNVSEPINDKNDDSNHTKEQNMENEDTLNTKEQNIENDDTSNTNSNVASNESDEYKKENMTKNETSKEQEIKEKVDENLDKKTEKIIPKNDDDTNKKLEKNDQKMKNNDDEKKEESAEKIINGRKRGQSAVQKEKQIRKKSRAVKGSITPPKLGEKKVIHSDGTEEFVQIKMVHLFARCRCHHRLNNFKNMNYASKSFQLDPKLVVSALDNEKNDRGQCKINNADYVFIKKNIGQQKEYKMALRTNGDDINDAIMVLGFVEVKLDESLESVKKITKFNHDVCFQSIIAEMNQANKQKK